MCMLTAPRLTLTCVFISVLLGCADDGSSGVGPSSTRRVVAGANGTVNALTAQPLAGRCDTEFAPFTFPLPPVVVHVVTGTCQLTHLGRSTLYLRQVINFASGEITSQELTFTAANGDVLWAVEEGSSPPPSGPEATFSGTFTFVGGTGRFAHATGTATFTGGANLVTNTGFFTMDGTILYAASDRSD